MTPDDAQRRAQEFDFAGEIITAVNAESAGVGTGRMLIVKAPGEEPRVGREAAEHLRSLLAHLSAKREQAGRAIVMIAGGSAKDVMNGERIALARLEKEGG